MQTDRLSRPLVLGFLACALSALPARSDATDDAIQPGQWRTKE